MCPKEICAKKNYPKKSAQLKHTWKFFEKSIIWEGPEGIGIPPSLFYAVDMSVKLIRPIDMGNFQGSAQ